MITYLPQNNSSGHSGCSEGILIFIHVNLLEVLIELTSGIADVGAELALHGELIPSLVPVHLLGFGRVVVTSPAAQHRPPRLAEDLPTALQDDVAEFHDLLAAELRREGGDGGRHTDCGRW